MSELTLQQVSYRYPGGSRYALDGISGTFSAGKLYAVIGPSGSGKSTLLSLMAGLDRPTEGSLQLNGSDYRSLNLDRCRRQEIAMIFQAFQLFPLLTVLENVCFPMEANGVKQKEAKAKAKELLTSVGISEEQHQRYPANLSGGEQQRVAIARALSSGAGIILADSRKSMASMPMPVTPRPRPAAPSTVPASPRKLGRWPISLTLPKSSPRTGRNKLPA